MSKCSRFPDKPSRLPEENHPEGKLKLLLLCPVNPFFLSSFPLHCRWYSRIISGTVTAHTAAHVLNRAHGGHDMSLFTYSVREVKQKAKRITAGTAE